MHSHIVESPSIWECISIYWGTAVYGNAFPYTGFLSILASKASIPTTKSASQQDSCGLRPQGFWVLHVVFVFVNSGLVGPNAWKSAAIPDIILIIS
jgi:hypothetical protein